MVTFFDQGTGAIISSVRMPIERLPDTFATDFELKMAGADYLVMKADPPTKREFAATRQLKVVLRRRSP